MNGEILQRLAAQFGDLRPMSAWAVTAGLMAAETDGIQGTLMVHIPPKTRDLVDVSFVSGKARLVVEGG